MSYNKEKADDVNKKHLFHVAMLRNGIFIEYGGYICNSSLTYR